MHISNQILAQQKRQELVMRLDILMPMNWMLEISKQENKPVRDMLKQVVETNQEWVEEVTKYGMNRLSKHRLTDVVHDFIGIYESANNPDDDAVVPRIS